MVAFGVYLLSKSVLLFIVCNHNAIILLIIINYCAKIFCVCDKMRTFAVENLSK
ncbi:hypothetical protein PREVCOP_06696 [Segatella copri DSM 18205]|uniref:Uncharacterized protein n=1 Tax=Segatella copri DSM 18205 TaxID=537011 RepID=D1PHH6_9BACT|nr:hypothetical protein PREVCOP_06696 [Segatella copri DSM 18205]